MKVKVRRSKGTTGNQRNFGLVTGSIWNYEDKPTSNNVGTTLSAVPRDEANIEAERGETVVGDLDNDGTLEHAKIGGKRHYAGGTPLSVPDGSFIFSDTPALRIKNPDMLKNIFGMSGSKVATPAEVAKRYEINKYKEILNDPNSEPLDKKTAQLMIDNNMKKLGQLALVQEGMKGFPDGIPDIALPLFGSDIGQSQPMQQPSQEQPVARYGGVPQYKEAGQKKIERRYPGAFDAELQTPYVKRAYDLYDKALQSNDPKIMESLAREIKNIDVPHSMTMPGTTLLEGLRTVLPMFTGSWLPSIPQNEPTGLTWQEKVNDMGDQLLNKAGSMRYTDTIEKSAKSREKSITNYAAALQSANKTADSILNNPNSTIKQMEAASNIKKSNDIALESAEYDPVLALKRLNTFLQTATGKQPDISTAPVKSNALQIQDFTSSTITLPNKNTSASPVVVTPPANPRIKVIDPNASTVTDEEIKNIISTSLGLPMDSIQQAQVDAYRGRMREGGELPKAQIAGQFIVNDPKLQAAAAQKKLKITRPYSHYDPQLPIIGSQLPSSKKYEVSPEGIIYRSGTAIPKIDEYKNYPVDWNQYGKDGFEQWKKDVAAGKGKASPASKWFTEQADKYAVSKTGVPYFGSGAKEAIPGYKWSTAPIFEDQPAEVVGETPVVPPPTKTTMEDVGETKYETGVEQTPWWNYDEVNYANQLGNYASIEPGNLPPYQQYNPYLARPTFVDPARAIAQQQGLVRGSQEAIMSGASPTAGRANVIAAQAAAAPQVANIMAQYDQSNVGIANQYGQQNAQTMNQAQMQNMQLKKQYADELEVRRQQYVNALREGKTNVAESIMQAMKNSAETGWQNAQSDSYSVDPRSGNVYFKRGFDPKTGAYRSNGSTPGELLKMYTSPPYRLSTKEAIDFIIGTRGKTKVTPEAQYGGMFNPMELIWNS